MSEYGRKWSNLKEWMLHLQRKHIDVPINPGRDNYTDGFNDAIDMAVRWMQAEDMNENRL